MAGTVKLLAVLVLALMAGTAFGYAITLNKTMSSDEEDNGALDDTGTGSSVILDKSTTTECAWDSEPNHGMPAKDHTLLKACGKLTGRVVLIEMYVEGESDLYHFLLRPDGQYTSMLNDGNNQKLGGALMIEINKEDQGVLPRLHVGQHLEIQGPHVLDEGTGYNEIHPVEVIKEL